MFGSQTRFFAIAIVVCVACASLAHAKQYVLSADFIETREDRPNSHISGKFYYRYDSRDIKQSRLRLDYTVSAKGIPSTVVSNLYDYNVSALFSMCDVCTADSFSEIPEPMWKSANFTKTDDVEEGLHWYRHTDSIVKTQLARILVSDHTDPTNKDFQLRGIEFPDGRLLKFTTKASVKTNGFNDEVFNKKPGLSCPEPSCSVFVDIALIMDYSRSVGTKWNKAIEFAVDIMKKFTFGPTAAAAVGIRFDGKPCEYANDRRTRVMCNDDGTGGDWWDHKVDRYWKDQTFDYFDSAQGIAGREIGFVDKVPQYTLTTNQQEILADLEKNKCGNSCKDQGCTCLAAGFEIAIDIFSKNTRLVRGRPPERIVIALTDGDDWCPNDTAKYAKILRDEYNATIIGVGVGLACDYDRHYLENKITSVMNSKPAYIPVDGGYDALQSVVGSLFQPICDQFHTDCGLECEAFCGCGKCWCPTCTDTHDACEYFACDTDDKQESSHGCELTTPQRPNDALDTLCTTYECTTVDKKAKYIAHEHCKPQEDEVKGTCRQVYCDDETGECKVKLIPEVCEQFQTNCEKWKCADVSETPTDEATGCMIVTNRTQECLDEAGKKVTCFNVKCDLNDEKGKCIYEDTCDTLNTKCTTFSCGEIDGGEYDCLPTPTKAPENNTACKFYECSLEDGWDKPRIENASTCEDHFNKEGINSTCKIFYCDKIEGCGYYLIDNCKECEDKIPECIKEANERSTLGECMSATCIVVEDEVTHITEGACNFSSISCLESSAVEEARTLNTNNPDVCFSIGCSYGECILINAPKPADNKCMKHVCKPVDGEIGLWNWVEEETETKLTCISDDCYYRVCDNKLGCNQTDICRVKSDECYSFTCNDVDGVKKCESKSLLNQKNYTCLNETCVDGKIKIVELKLEETCSYVNKCEVLTCSKAGKCVYTPKLPPDNDPCKIYSCDPTTGEYSYIPKCRDGIYCTEDSCTIDGECRFTPINCYLELDMTDYPCFRAECKENTGNYRCMRKLRTGVFIDVCGNCIKEDGTETSSEEEDGNTLTACTDAPDQPMTKEGLAAASIALIVLGAIIIGGIVGVSGFIGTKSLLERAKAADNQSAHNNPLYEETDTEMSNPAYTGSF